MALQMASRTSCSGFPCVWRASSFVETLSGFVSGKLWAFLMCSYDEWCVYFWGSVCKHALPEVARVSANRCGLQPCVAIEVERVTRIYQNCFPLSWYVCRNTRMSGNTTLPYTYPTRIRGSSARGMFYAARVGASRYSGTGRSVIAQTEVVELKTSTGVVVSLCSCTTSIRDRLSRAFP